MPTPTTSADWEQVLRLAEQWTSASFWRLLIEAHFRETELAERRDQSARSLKLGRMRARMAAEEYEDLVCRPPESQGAEGEVTRLQVTAAHRSKVEMDIQLRAAIQRNAKAEAELEAQRARLRTGASQLAELRALISQVAPELVDITPRWVVPADGNIRDCSEQLAQQMRHVCRTLMAAHGQRAGSPCSAAQAPPSPAKGRPVTPPDCTEFIWGERTFRFSPREAEVVRRLWEAHEANGNPEGLEAVCLLGLVGEKKRKGKNKLRDVFKQPGNQMNPAWGTLIIGFVDNRNRRAKRYRLNLTT